MNVESENNQEQEKPSKTRLKQESAALQDLAGELADLSKNQLLQMELPDEVFTSVCEAASMPHKGARKRLLKYIGAMLRKMDASPIQEQLSRIKNQSKHESRQLHQVEHWRDRLLAEGNQALTDLLMEYPQADRQLISQLSRNAKKESESGKPPKSARQLFKNLRTLFQQ